MGICKEIGYFLEETMDQNQIEELLKNHDERIKKLELLLQKDNSLNNSVKEKSIKEFIVEKSPKGTYNTGVAIAYYLEKYRKFSSFTSLDVEQGFRDAKVPLPQNMSDLMYKNTQNAFFMDAKELKNDMKAYVLTLTGEKLVECNFEKSRKKG